MQRRPVVVDGSNLATEGRSTPSLAQLDEAVRAWLAENPDDEVIVVVDASFSYRIDESEKQTFEDAEAAGEVVSPPAGALGRGDGFLLKIADRVDAAVLSNDSFQEFHGDYPWLFDSGRLLGGKPVPGVGWIFTPRTPVRGPKSRMAVRDAKLSKKAELSGPMVKAIEEATAEVMEPPGPEAKSGRRRRRRSRETASHEAVNDPLPFITFIAEHHLGTEVEGTVDSFTSHGAFVVVDGARCYVPVVGLADPPPRTAKAVLKRGETRTFVVQALDPPRRGIELALPEVARVAGAPTAETVEAEIDEGAKREAATGSRRRARATKATAPRPAEAETEVAPEEAAAALAPGQEPAPAPPKRPRRSTKKAAAAVPASPAADEPPPPTAAADAAHAAAGADDQPPAPPKRTRRAAKKAAPEVAPQPEAMATPDGQPPAPPKRTRRVAKKAAAAAAQPAPRTR